jgi:hypothetical protein
MVNKIIFVDKDTAAGASHTQPTGVFQGSNPAPTDDAVVTTAPLVFGIRYSMTPTTTVVRAHDSAINLSISARTSPQEHSYAAR